MLNLRHLKFANPKKSVPRRNFVPKAQPDLRGSEWHSATIVLQQFGEVHEYSLCCLRPQVTLRICVRTYARLEHQVERFGLRKCVARLWRGNL